MKLPASVARSDAHPTGIPEVAGSINRSGNLLVEIGHETISNVILSLPLIQVGQSSVLANGYALSTGYCLGLILPRNSVVRLTDHLDIIRAR